MKKWIEQIDKTTHNFHESFGALNSEELNWKPKSETWSIAQNIDHLIVINSTYFPIVEALRKGKYKAPFLSKIGFVVSFCGKTVLKAVQPDRKKKIKTFPIWEPAKSEIPKGILERLKNHQLELKEMINQSKDLVNKGVIISSPANKNIVYKLEMAFEIIVAHEQRHYEQAKEAYQLLKREADRQKSI
ncbi:DinB family protein [Maribacter halichondriae]|uniref:DinB family protein n=1 Tax=Maribacter halichondriae TaxID=2980554 RepID=UPI0023587609|nr:DinB family protein [Maribacter sp. Hal144]